MELERAGCQCIISRERLFLKGVNRKEWDNQEKMDHMWIEALGKEIFLYENLHPSIA